MAETAIKRPNGKPYRPRGVVAHAIVDEDELLCGVMVLGTHDIECATAMATAYARWQLGETCTAVDPFAGWYRDGFEGGHRRWIYDDERGRAGVWFREIVEALAGPPAPGEGER